MLEIKKSSFLKYNFFESELKLLGVVFSKAGKKIDPVKVQTITECPEPKTVKQLQRFLGMVNFVSGFIPHYATAMYPLYQLLKKSEKTFDCVIRRGKTGHSRNQKIFYPRDYDL